MLYANLYIDRIDLAPYLTPEDLRGAGVTDRAQLAARLREGSCAWKTSPTWPPGSAPPWTWPCGPRRSSLRCSPWSFPGR